MKIFISWSGETSRQLAQAVKNWIPTVLQAAKPYFTPDDIEKGKKWQSDILESLNESSIGIICLTADNLDKPWILFEAGALSNRLDNAKVCPLLFGVSKANVKGPLSLFQLTEFNKEDFKQLIKSINNQLAENKLTNDVLNLTFETFYPLLEKQAEDILTTNLTNSDISKVQRTDRELLEEILDLTRSQSKNDQTGKDLAELLLKNLEERNRKEFAFNKDGNYWAIIDKKNYDADISYQALLKKFKSNCDMFFDRDKDDEGNIDEASLPVNK